MSETNDASPLPVVLRPLGGVLAAGYGTAVRWRNHRFDRGHRVNRLPIPVISVGNLSVGGTGKTPVIASIARHLRDQGHAPLIAMRGYNARPGEPGDEQREHEQRNPDVPVVASPNRTAAVRAFLDAHPETHDCVLLDDGFQHRFVHRDLDIVLIDATRSPFTDRLLPAGWLREPIHSLARAHAVVITRTDLVEHSVVDAIESAVRRVNTDLDVASAQQTWSSLRQQEDERATSWLDGKRVHVVCAIGNPDAFVAMIERHGASVRSVIRHPDHAEYSRDDIATMQRVLAQNPADAWITTAKDWVKLAPVIDRTGADLPIVRPVLEISGDDRYESLLSRITALVSSGGSA